MICPAGIEAAKTNLEKLTQIVTDTDALADGGEPNDDVRGAFKNKDVYFCTLGTTRKQAGSAVCTARGAR